MEIISSHPIKHVRLSNWKQYSEFINDNFLLGSNIVFRGQHSDEWLLESKLERMLKYSENGNSETMEQWVLKRFQYACRGRLNGAPPDLNSDDEWWALGQHYGLATPLLDWTMSPYVAAFFAFHEHEDNYNDNVAIWGFNAVLLSEARESIKRLSGYKSEVAYIYSPLSHENPRLVNQNGIFVRMPPKSELSDQYAEIFSKLKDYMPLYKITIPYQERKNALFSLNKMNINYTTLFPDLIGASLYCNMDLEFIGYGSSWL